MTAIEATARTAKTLSDGTLRLIIEFEPKDAREAFNLFCEQGTKLGVAALKDGYCAEQHNLDQIPDGKQKNKIGSLPASSWAFMQTRNENFCDFMEVKNQDECDARLKELLCIKSKSEIDSNELVFAEFRRILRQFAFYCNVRGLNPTGYHIEFSGDGC